MTNASGWDWTTRAACKGIDVSAFFSPDGERMISRARREAKAKRVCRTCPVLKECREHALGADDRGLIVARGEPAGVWGGMTEDERHSERRRRMRTDRPANRAKAG